MEIDKKTLNKIKKGLRIFLIITVISITAILIVTVKKETFSSLKQVSPLFLTLTLSVCLFRMYLECLRLQTLTWAFGNPIDLRSSAEFTIGGYFLSLTPFGAGGLPLQVYILKKKKFSFGESGAVIALRGITSLIAFAFGIPILLSSRSVFDGAGIRILSGYLITLYAILIILLVLVLIKTDWVKYQLSRFSNFLTCHGKGKLARLVNKFSNELEKFKFGFKECWSKGRYKLILTIIISVISLFFYVLIAPLLFRGIGIIAPVIKTAIIQLILTFTLMFVPTPGGSGIAEGAGFALFKGICTKQELLGIYVVLWRLFTYYIGVIIGGFIILRMLVGNKTSKLKECHSEPFTCHSEPFICHSERSEESQRVQDKLREKSQRDI